jgi:anaerobic sulfite reductase subunit C
MRWSKSAEQALSKVPFFVRRRVRRKVEEEADRQRAAEVTLDHVRICQQKFLKNMEDEIKGFQLEICFGSSGCPNRIPSAAGFPDMVEQILKKKDLKTFLKEVVKGPLKFHHEFRVSISDCPNACSRPQICDLGLIAAVIPSFSDLECSHCGACSEICIEKAVTLTDHMIRPEFDMDKCLYCGNCVKVCPTGSLKRGLAGYRIMIGGKLGRHPRLATEIGGVFSEQNTLEAVNNLLDFYMKNCLSGERFGEILERVGITEIDQRIIPLNATGH